MDNLDKYWIFPNFWYNSEESFWFHRHRGLWTGNVRQMYQTMTAAFTLSFSLIMSKWNIYGRISNGEINIRLPPSVHVRRIKRLWRKQSRKIGTKEWHITSVFSKCRIRFFASSSPNINYSICSVAWSWSGSKRRELSLMDCCVDCSHSFNAYTEVDEKHDLMLQLQFHIELFYSLKWENKQWPQPQSQAHII